jgi:hypothetical protein
VREAAGRTAAPAPPGPAARGLLWLACAFAFSPVVRELVADWANVFAAGSLAVPVLLLLRVAWLPRGLPAAGAPRLGLLAVMAGLAIELLGIAAGAWSIARIGPALAIAGMLVWASRWPVADAAIALWLVPIPAFAYVTTTPTVETAYGALATAAVSAVGPTVEQSGPLIRSGASVLELQPSYNGLHVTWLLALTGWYGAVRRGGDLLPAIRSALLRALLGPPIQLVATGVAVAAVSLGVPGAGRLWMEHGLWMAVALFGCLGPELAVRTAPSHDTATRSGGIGDTDGSC